MMVNVLIFIETWWLILIWKQKNTLESIVITYKEDLPLYCNKENSFVPTKQINERMNMNLQHHLWCSMKVWNWMEQTKLESVGMVNGIFIIIIKLNVNKSLQSSEENFEKCKYWCPIYHNNQEISYEYSYPWQPNWNWCHIERKKFHAPINTE